MCQCKFCWASGQRAFSSDETQSLTSVGTSQAKKNFAADDVSV